MPLPRALPSRIPSGPIKRGYYLPNYSSLASFLAANPGWALPTNYSGALPAPITAAPGIFNGGTYTIANIAEAAQADYFLIGWTGSYASYDAAAAAALNNPTASFLGMSGVATTATGDPLATPPGTAVLLRSTFAGMTLTPARVVQPALVPCRPTGQPAGVRG